MKREIFFLPKEKSELLLMMLSIEAIGAIGDDSIDSYRR